MKRIRKIFPHRKKAVVHRNLPLLTAIFPINGQNRLLKKSRFLHKSRGIPVKYSYSTARQPQSMESMG